MGTTNYHHCVYHADFEADFRDGQQRFLLALRADLKRDLHRINFAIAGLAAGIDPNEEQISSYYENQLRQFPVLRE